MKMVIEIDNVTDSQKEAIEDLLATWQWLGSIGGSRWTGFYADGDGNFRPKIKVDGFKPEFTKKLLDRKPLWVEDEYRIDYDMLTMTN